MPGLQDAGRRTQRRAGATPGADQPCQPASGRQTASACGPRRQANSTTGHGSGSRRSSSTIPSSPIRAGSCGSVEAGPSSGPSCVRRTRPSGVSTLGGPMLAEARKRLDGYAASVPHHNLAGFGTRATITALTEWCVYTVSVQAVFETRRLGSGEVAYSGWRLPTVPADPARLDVWDFRYRPPVGLTGRSENILHGTQVPRACEPCGGRGDVTCATCSGGRAVACPSCSGRGTEECERCGGDAVRPSENGDVGRPRAVRPLSRRRPQLRDGAI